MLTLKSAFLVCLSLGLVEAAPQLRNILANENGLLANEKGRGRDRVLQGQRQRLTAQEQADQIPQGLSVATDGSIIMDATARVNGQDLRFKVSAPADQFTKDSGVKGGKQEVGAAGTLGVNVLLHGDGGQSFFDFPNQAVQNNLVGVALLAPDENLFWGGGSGLERTDGEEHAQIVNDFVQQVLPKVMAFDNESVSFTGVSGGSLLLSGFFMPAHMQNFAAPAAVADADKALEEKLDADKAAEEEKKQAEEEKKAAEDEEKEAEKAEEEVEDDKKVDAGKEADAEVDADADADVDADADAVVDADADADAGVRKFGAAAGEGAAAAGPAGRILKNILGRAANVSAPAEQQKGSQIILNCGALAPQVAVSPEAAAALANTRLHFQSTQKELAILQESIPEALVAYSKLVADAGLSEKEISALQTVDNSPNGGHCEFDEKDFVSGVQLMADSFSAIVQGGDGNLNGTDINVLNPVLGNEKLVFSGAS
ncbi:hypothetical protein F4808DRAFT_469095 [Astrocystis sublimbata]|nr:hypothetical protein F4808DRAFT_469095 [Astrocystis sublimbata]